MSLGFLTESALIPKKANDIKVDSSSMVQLRAVLSQKQQQMRQQGSHQSLRKRARVPAKRDHRSSNRGVEARDAIDEYMTKQEGTSRKRQQNQLQRKAAAYDSIVNGSAPDALRDRVQQGGLVDFEGKPPAPARSVSPNAASDVHQQAGEGLVEIEDEFGRSVWVKRGSEKYMEFLAQKRTAARDGPREQMDRAARNAAAALGSHHASPSFDEDGGVVFPVSSGMEHDNDARYSHRDADSVAGMSLIDDPEYFGGRSGVVKSGLIKQAYEQVMSSKTKHMLEDVKRDTVRGRLLAQQRRQQQQRDEDNEAGRKQAAAQRTAAEPAHTTGSGAVSVPGVSGPSASEVAVVQKRAEQRKRKAGAMLAALLTNDKADKADREEMKPSQRQAESHTAEKRDSMDSTAASLPAQAACRVSSRGAAAPSSTRPAQAKAEAEAEAEEESRQQSQQSVADRKASRPHIRFAEPAPIPFEPFHPPTPHGTPPLPPPGMWLQTKDPQSGTVYWYVPNTNWSSWGPPPKQ